jgi:hypothetical protein
MTGPGKYKCACKKGWAGNGKSCHEFDACSTKPCDAHAKCTSTGPGTYKCACAEGFKACLSLCLLPCLALRWLALLLPLLG